MAQKLGSLIRTGHAEFIHCPAGDKLIAERGASDQMRRAEKGRTNDRNLRSSTSAKVYLAK